MRTTTLIMLVNDQRKDLMHVRWGLYPRGERKSAILDAEKRFKTAAKELL